MKLVLPKEAMDQIRDHGRKEYPAEACGVLLGSVGADIDVKNIKGMENIRKKDTHYEFVIPPEALLGVMKEARSQGMDICGFYHSHPDHPAKPSEKDRTWGGETWPGVAHVILAVEKAQPKEARAYVYETAGRDFVEIPISRPPLPNPPPARGGGNL